ncbi:MAG: pyrimidine-nucleoside phosphorylase, partial [Oscillospiraceae bacterium]|nr:pyrimidine-nucleoside phosphorylase [Oscillospiraceae bacterium]
EAAGRGSMRPGGGRRTKDSEIDLSVGEGRHKKVGDPVQPGESLGTVYARTEEEARAGAEQLTRCYALAPEKTERPPFIKGVVT